MPTPRSNSVTGALMNGASWGPASHVTVDSSFLAGGPGADMAEGCSGTYISVTNTAFSSDNGWGGTDYIYGFNPSGAGMVWSGNYIPETNGGLSRAAHHLLRTQPSLRAPHPLESGQDERLREARGYDLAGTPPPTDRRA